MPAPKTIKVTSNDQKNLLGSAPCFLEVDLTQVSLSRLRRRLHRRAKLATGTEVDVYHSNGGSVHIAFIALEKKAGELQEEIQLLRAEISAQRERDRCIGLSPEDQYVDMVDEDDTDHTYEDDYSSEDEDEYGD